MAAPDRYPYERLLAEFDQLVRAAQQTLAAQIDVAIRSGDLQTARGREAQLAAATATIERLGIEANPLASKAVQEAWQQSSDRAVTLIRALGIVRPVSSFAGVSQEALQQLQLSLLDRLDSAQQTLGRKVADVYAREQRQAAVHAILGAAGSPDQASKDLQQRLMRDKRIRKAVSEGKGAFVDRSGRAWSLETYSNMAVRTVTREAVVQGAITRMASHGIPLARVSTHPGACPICQPFEGTLVDIGEAGITEWKGEAVSDASAIPPYHPNCAHSLMPVAVSIEQLREANTEAEPAIA